STRPAPTTAVHKASATEASAAAATASSTTAMSTTPARPNSPPRQSRPHSHAITAAAAPVNSGSQGHPNQMAATGNGPSTTADTARSASGLLAGQPPASLRRRIPDSARTNGGPIAALAAAELFDRLLQVGFRKIWPQCLRKDQLGICALPQQKVADALFATGSDQQIRVGKIRRGQVAGETCLVDCIRGKAARRHLSRNLANRSDNLRARTIRQCDR